MRARHVLLPTVGSAGDVHPMMALGLALQARGHRATVITNGYFRELIEGQGLGFLEAGRASDADAVISNPDLWHARKGFEIVARHAMLPVMPLVYRHIERVADASTVVAASGPSLGARIAHEALGVPLASVHLQPSIIRSYVDAGMVGTMRISAAQPRWFKRAFFWLADRALIDRVLAGPVNAFRATLGLAPITRLFDRWLHSPQLVIGFFPEWFAQPQPDWPPHTHLVGFPLWDTATPGALPTAAEAFLDAGPAPIVFTPGSAGAVMQSYFAASVAAATRLGLRAMLVTNFPAQVPAGLPATIQTFGYLPFSALLPRAAALVYHGGIGTLAQAIRAGIPHLVVPHGHDQFDNAWRISQLGLGTSVPATRYQGARVTSALEAVAQDTTMRARCAQRAHEIDSTDALARACALIEALP